MDTTDRIFVALDGLGLVLACQLVRTLSQSPYAENVAGYKIHDLWDENSPDVVRRLRDVGAKEVFPDLKLHDTPRTVGLRARVVAKAGADILTVHASGGLAMMQAAVESGLKILAITVLTSLTETESYLYYGQPIEVVVLKCARMAKRAGTWGVVSSAHEVGSLSQTLGLENLKLVVPAIRFGGEIAFDENQKRVDSAVAAFGAGADYIVVGSELTKAEDPVMVLGHIVEQVALLTDRVQRR